MSIIKAVDIGKEFGSSFGDTKSIGDLVSVVVTGSITVAGIIVLFLIVGGALRVIMSAGSGDAKGAESGKQALTWAVFGFVLIIVSFFIIRIIETITGQSFITMPFNDVPCVPGSPC